MIATWFLECSLSYSGDLHLPIYTCTTLLTYMVSFETFHLTTDDSDFMFYVQPQIGVI